MQLNINIYKNKTKFQLMPNESDTNNDMPVPRIMNSKIFNKNHDFNFYQIRMYYKLIKEIR